MRSFRLVNATIILPHRTVAGAAIHIDDGRISALGPDSDLGAWSGVRLDAAGQFVAPGFIDLHVHGGDNADFMDGTIEAFETVIRAHTRHGTTTIVPTSTVAVHEQTLAFLQNARGPQQLVRVLRRYVQHYNQHRPHRSLAHATPVPSYRAEARDAPNLGRLRRRDVLGGLIHEYRYAA